MMTRLQGTLIMIPVLAFGINFFIPKKSMHADRCQHLKKILLGPLIDEMERIFGEESIFIDEISKEIDGYEHTGDMLGTLLAAQSGSDLGIKEALEKSGKDTVTGLISGLNSEQKAAYDEARELGLSVLEAYDAALDINSPSREMEKRGGYTIEGLVNGLTNNMSLLDSALDDMLGRFDFLSTIQSFWKKVTDWWRNISLPDVDLKMPHFSWTTQPAEGWVADILKNNRFRAETSKVKR